MNRSPPEHADEFRSTLLAWATDNLRSFPWREPERSFYEVFVAEFLLTQTPAGNVAGVYPEFLSEFPTLRALRDAETDRLRTVIEPLGFQRIRSEALIEIAATHHELPRERSELIELPRVGPYVADATVCFACSRRVPILDRNVVRVYDRVFGGSFPESRTDRRAFAERLLPETGIETRRYNLALVDFGALVCEKRRPRCEECFAADYCRYYDTVREQIG